MAINEHKVSGYTRKDGTKVRTHTSRHKSAESKVDLSSVASRTSRAKPANWTGLPPVDAASMESVNRHVPAGFRARRVDETKYGAVRYVIESDGRPEAAWHFYVKPDDTDEDVARRVAYAVTAAEEQFAGAKLVARVEPFVPEGYALENGWFNPGLNIVSTTDDPNVYYLEIDVVEESTPDEIRAKLASAVSFIAGLREDYQLLDRLGEKLGPGHEVVPDYYQERDDTPRRFEVFTPADKKVLVTVARGASDSELLAAIKKARLKLA